MCADAESQSRNTSPRRTRDALRLVEHRVGRRARARPAWPSSRAPRTGLAPLDRQIDLLNGSDAAALLKVDSGVGDLPQRLIIRIVEGEFGADVAQVDRSDVGGAEPYEP